LAVLSLRAISNVLKSCLYSIKRRDFRHETNLITIYCLAHRKTTEPTPIEEHPTKLCIQRKSLKAWSKIIVNQVFCFKHNYFFYVVSNRSANV